jgi:hypothetical protein
MLNVEVRNSIFLIKTIERSETTLQNSAVRCSNLVKFNALFHHARSSSRKSGNGSVIWRAVDSIDPGTLQASPISSVK